MRLYSLLLSYPLLLLSLTTFLSASSTGHALHKQVLETIRRDDNDNALQLSKRAGPRFQVRGVQGAGVKPRLELRELAQNADMLNLLLQGWEKFMAMDQDNTLSYYQIAGIHGTPYTSWQGIETDAGARAGYCPHYSNIFMSWHRPYLALFEQVLYANIQDVVLAYPSGPERLRMTNIAKDIRLPYWDWARDPIPDMGGVIPDILANTEVEVRRPNGTLETIPNPLYSYKFRPLNSAALFDAWSGGTEKFAVTKRRPIGQPGNLSLDAVDNIAEAHYLFYVAQPGYKERVYNIFWKFDNYTTVSNAAWWGGSDAPANQDSLELIHGMAHVNIGGLGHMLYTPMSSFDPSFWLHHAMIDRLSSIWEALHPDSYVEPATQKYSTFAFKSGTVLDVNSQLYPFPRTQDKMWTSAEARKPQVFSYTYKELQLNSTEAITAAINALYGPSSATAITKRRTKHRSTDDRIIDPSADFVEYTASVKVDRLAIAGSFTVFFFIDDPSGPPNTWDTAVNLVGSLPVFSMHPSLSPGTKLEDLEPDWISGPIPLTREVQRRWQNGEIDDVREKVVVPWLHKRLKWRVRKTDLTEVALDQISSLNVTLLTSAIRPPQEGAAFPVQISEVAAHPQDEKEDYESPKQYCETKVVTVEVEA